MDIATLPRTGWCLVAGLLLLSPVQAQARSRQDVFEFTAVVTASDGTVAEVGQEVAGSFSINDDPTACGAGGGYEAQLESVCHAFPTYPGDPEWFMSVSVGDSTEDLVSSSSQWRVSAWLGREYYESDSDLILHGPDTFKYVVKIPGGGRIRITLEDPTGTALEGVDGTEPPLPTDLHLHEWQEATLVLSDTSLGSFEAQITSIHAVCPRIPDPPLHCFEAPKSRLLIKDRHLAGVPGASAGDRVVWKWLRGVEPATQSDFAAPTLDTGYAVCVYAGAAAALALELNIPAAAYGGSWRALGATGFKYLDRLLANDGVQAARLMGGPSGVPKALVTAKGDELPMSDDTLPLDNGGDVIVQLHHDASHGCWESVFTPSAVKRNEVKDGRIGVFKAVDR